MNNSASFWDSWHDISADNASLTTNDPARINGIYAKNTVTTLTKHIPKEMIGQLTFLDYGCGTGRLAKFFAPICKSVICADVSTKFLDSAKNNLKEFSNIDYFLLNSANPKIEVEDRGIDFIYSYASLSYTTESNFWAALNEIDRAAKSFCVQINSDPNEDLEEIIPDTEANIDIHKIRGYRPKSTTLFRRFTDTNYIIERLAPDIRGSDRFFFKLAFEYNK